MKNKYYIYAYKAVGALLLTFVAYFATINASKSLQNGTHVPYPYAYAHRRYHALKEQTDLHRIIPQCSKNMALQVMRGKK